MRLREERHLQTVSPFQVNSPAFARAQSPDLTVRPSGRNLPFEQNFTDCADHSKVAVDLERRAADKDIVHGVVSEKRLKHLARLVAIAEPSPERGTPRPCPAAAGIA